MCTAARICCDDVICSFLFMCVLFWSFVLNIFVVGASRAAWIYLYVLFPSTLLRRPGILLPAVCPGDTKPLNGGAAGQ